MQTETRLTFIEGQFFLTDPPPQKFTDQWVKVDTRTYVTRNLKAAAEFRRFTDETCDRVFNRAFNRVYDLPNLPPLPFLDEHQHTGLRWVLTRRRSYLAHAPGAGKTLQAIVASILSDKIGQTIFIVPPSLTVNWKREIERFAPELGEYPSIAIVPLSARKGEMNWHADYIIVPDSMLWADWVWLKIRDLKIKFIAVDEASRFKEQSSKRSLAFYGGTYRKYKYPGMYQKAHHVVFLDGSPMPNRAVELWAPVYALDPLAIDALDYQDFGFRYGGAVMNDRGQWEFKGTSHEKELKAKLRATFMHVVTEDELSHPERRRSILMMNEDVRSHEQKTWERKHLSKIKELDEQTSQGELATFRLELGLRKVPFIARYVAERLRETNESILLFVWHREVALRLHSLLGNFKPGLVMGGTDAAYRENIFEAFQKGDCRLITGNVQAMGRGHNLQRADRIIFGEFSWTDETNKQCEKRASRRGRDNSAFVRCEYIVCPDSIDEKVLGSVFTKERRVKRVIG